MAVAVFDFTAFSARYPAIATAIGQPLATAYFAEAGLYVSNLDSSRIADIPTRSLILNMVTAHIALLNGAGTGGQALPVGRISSAAEGSVSVQTQLDIPAGSSAWFAQTQPGLAAWQALTPYRQAIYVPGSPRNMNPTTSPSSSYFTR